MGTKISLHDTRTGQVRPLETREPGRVGIYTCGPTVYGRIHVGNARPFVVFSLLKRFLEHEGHRVLFVTNITDVNDKIYAAAVEAGRRSDELAEEMIVLYVADTDRLGLGRPDREPLASAAIDDMIELIGELIEGGHAYAVDGDVYFRVRSYPEYGELAIEISTRWTGRGRRRRRAQARSARLRSLEGPQAGEDTAWDSPWGPGRPGWHIECSAMAEAILGTGFEIHGGGSDLIFPHHENEAAQTAAAHGEPLARLWVHNGMVRLQEAKMAKSVGNIFLLHEALDAFGRDALIMYFCGGHYRQPIEFDDERLEQARASVGRVREAARRLVPGASPPWSADLRQSFFAALAEDFNTPAALAAAFEWIREANRSDEPVGSADLDEMLDVLGLANLLETEPSVAPDEVRSLAGARERAREARDYGEADRLRDRIRELGWDVRDAPGGPELLPLQ